MIISVDTDQFINIIGISIGGICHKTNYNVISFIMRSRDAISIPKEVFNITAIRGLNVYNIVLFNSIIPSHIRNLVNLKYLLIESVYISNTNFIDSLPKFIKYRITTNMIYSTTNNILDKILRK